MKKRIARGMVAAAIAMQCAAAGAQTPQATLNTAVAVQLPSAQGLTALQLRTFLINSLIPSIYQSQGANGLLVSGVPSAGQAPVATGPTAATWANIPALAGNNVWTGVQAFNGGGFSINATADPALSITSLAGPNRAIVESGNLSGSATSFGLNWNSWVFNDAVNAGTQFVNGLLVLDQLNSASATGGRQAVFGFVNQTVATNSASGNRNYVGVIGATTTTSGDGGTGLSTADAKGAYFGGNSAVSILGGTNIFSANAHEFDVFGVAGVSYLYSMGIAISDIRKVQGTLFDAAIDIGGGSAAGAAGPAVGWRCGMCFTDIHGASPVQANTTLFGSSFATVGVQTITTGIDLTGFHFSSYAAHSRGMALNEDTGLAGSITPAGGLVGAGLTFLSLNGGIGSGFSMQSAGVELGRFEAASSTVYFLSNNSAPMQFATQAGGVFAMTITNAGGVFIGNNAAPADPGVNNLTVAGLILASGSINATGAFIAKGAVPTGNTGSCTASSFTGGTTAGKFSAAICAGGTFILSGLPTAPNGYTCTAQDQTTPADTLKQTANTVTSVTFTATTVAADVVAFQCMAW